jgi:hypothetical protein
VFQELISIVAFFFFEDALFLEVYSFDNYNNSYQKRQEKRIEKREEKRSE